jgi:Fe-S cluster assembly ATP-binding protein
MLEIKNLHAIVEGEDIEILKGVNLTVSKGEIHAIMGPNGSGKSTLSKIVAGHPGYEVTQGDIIYDGESILEMDPDERAHAGIFLAFQYPVEVPGVTNMTLLRESYNTIAKSRGREEMDPLEFEDYLKTKLDLVEMNPEFLHRSVNTAFSGGEKKRNEISGLDIDALRIVSGGINQIHGDEDAVVMVTHYQRLLEYIVPDVVHVMIDGVIVKTGGKELALELEEKGYDWLEKA